MKKYLLLLVCVVSISPLYAQGREVGRGLKTAANISEKVGRQLTEQTLKASLPPGTVLARIANFAGEPLVRVELPDISTPPTGTMQVLPARILTGEEFRQGVFPEYKFRHLPLSLGSGNRALYRGMALGKVDEVTNILTNGVQIEKTSFPHLSQIRILLNSTKLLS